MHFNAGTRREAAGALPSRANPLRALCAGLTVASGLAAMLWMFAVPAGAPSQALADGWTRHAIDQSSRGADGVRFGDWNQDGLPDIVTGWEEGGVVRVYLHPGPDRVREPWPRLNVGRIGDLEDAVFADLDGDGELDVVSAAEGTTQALSVHWSPRSQDVMALTSEWPVGQFPNGPRQRWMFALPMELGGMGAVDVVAGGKGEGAQLGWFRSPGKTRDLRQWTWHPLRRLGWVMSLMAADMDGDGDDDILFTDRKGDHRGAGWLENPGRQRVEEPWREHTIGSTGDEEVMFLAYADLDADGMKDLIVATKPQDLVVYRRLDTKGAFAAAERYPFPPNAGTAKGIAAGDINGDGVADLIFSCEHATGEKRGLMALLGSRDKTKTFREFVDISGTPGAKFDLVQLADLDGDGDLDVITCEETENLGVIWYENPARR